MSSKYNDQFVTHLLEFSRSFLSKVFDSIIYQNWLSLRWIKISIIFILCRPLFSQEITVKQIVIWPQIWHVIKKYGKWIFIAATADTTSIWSDTFDSLIQWDRQCQVWISCDLSVIFHSQKSEIMFIMSI